MNLMSLLRYSLANAFRRKGRAALSIVAVMIGAFTFTITSGLSGGINAYIDSQETAFGRRECRAGLG